MATLEQKLQEMLQGAVEDLGCELWGIECQRAGRFMTVRLFIDKEGGVGVELSAWCEVSCGAWGVELCDVYGCA